MPPIHRPNGAQREDRSLPKVDASGCGPRACAPSTTSRDITNYVMLEYGQPHACRITARKGGRSCPSGGGGRELTTLDGSVRKLNPNMLVIADEHRAVGLAGIMGGLNSEIVSDTADVVFESANFDGTTIRRTALALGMRTEASAKYEKGLTPEFSPPVERAGELVELLGPARWWTASSTSSTTSLSPGCCRSRRNINAPQSTRCRGDGVHPEEAGLPGGGRPGHRALLAFRRGGHTHLGREAVHPRIQISSPPHVLRPPGRLISRAGAGAALGGGKQHAAMTSVSSPTPSFPCSTTTRSAGFGSILAASPSRSQPSGEDTHHAPRCPPC